MIQKIVWSFCLVWVVLGSGCGKKSRMPDMQGAKILSIDVEHDIKTESDFVNALDSVRFIIIKDSAVVGISKVVAYNDCYYILDRTQNVVSVLDGDGNLKYRLSRKGRAKHEYLEISDFTVSGEKLTVYDQSAMRMIDYDISTGIYMSSFDVQDIYSNVCRIDNNLLVAYSSYGLSTAENKMLAVFDSSVVDRYIEKPFFLNERINIEQSSPVSRYMDRMYVTPLFSDFIYSVDSDSVKSRYYIDFGKYQLPERFYRRVDNEDSNKMLSDIYKSDYAHNVDHFIETKDYIYFIFAYHLDDYSVYYNKKTSKCLLFIKTAFGEDTRIWACNNHVSNTETDFVSWLYLANVQDDVESPNPILQKLIGIASEAGGRYEFAIAVYKFK